MKGFNWYNFGSMLYVAVATFVMFLSMTTSNIAIALYLVLLGLILFTIAMLFHIAYKVDQLGPGQPKDLINNYQRRAR